jgi:hypothetical protein
MACSSFDYNGFNELLAGYLPMTILNTLEPMAHVALRFQLHFPNKKGLHIITYPPQPSLCTPPID